MEKISLMEGLHSTYETHGFWCLAVRFFLLNFLLPGAFRQSFEFGKNSKSTKIRDKCKYPERR